MAKDCGRDAIVESLRRTSSITSASCKAGFSAFGGENRRASRLRASATTCQGGSKSDDRDERRVIEGKMSEYWLNVSNSDLKELSLSSG